MPIEPADLDEASPDEASPYIAEYLLVSDRDSKIIKSSEDYTELKKLANLIRRSGGEVTLFKSLKA